MTTMHAFVPHCVRWCPAFAACFVAIDASASELDMPHAHYSWLMSWGNQVGMFTPPGLVLP